jgi:chromosome partitioning protein
MKTIAVLSRKGGAGKTTLAVSLGIAAQQAGLRAVVADIDPLRSAAVVLGSRADAASILIETTGRKLKAVRDACSRSGCDLLILDTPPSPLNEVIKAIEISDFCLAVARPTALDLAAIEETIQLIGKHRRDGLVVLNQCPPARNGIEAGVTRRALQTLEFSRVPVAQIKIRSRLSYQQAASERLGVTEFAPQSEAALDLQRLLLEAGERIARGPARREDRSFLGRSAVSGGLAMDEPWGATAPGLVVAASAASFWEFA